MNIRAHILRDVKLTGWKEKIAGRWHYRDLANDPAWREGWISFDTVTFNPDDGNIYCGLNSIDGDLLYRFDPTTNQFTGLNTKRWTDAFDSKIHRTLLHNPADGCFHFATSLLHDVDQQREAKGGKIVRYDPKKDEYTILGIPAPMLYIQSIAADFQRGLIFGFTYPAEGFFQFDIKTGKSEILAYIGNCMFFSQPHNPVIDSNGWIWGTCAETRAWDETLGATPIRLFKYHPEGKRFVWFDFGLSRKAETKQLLPDPEKPKGVEALLGETRHKDDYGFCDSMLYDGKRYIYAGTVAGVLCRIDTHTDRVEKLAHVMVTGRFPALCMDGAGTLYGAGGLNGHTQLMRWKIGSDKIEGYFDHADGPIHAFGEMVALLWEDGNVDAAIELESRWNDLHREREFSLYCAYPMSLLEESGDLTAAKHVCDQHSQIIRLSAPAAAARPPASRSTASSDRVFVPAPAVIREVRAFVREVLREWGAEGCVAEAEVIVTELASNAVVHARSPFRVSLVLSGPEIMIAVRDASSVPPRCVYGHPDRHGGRGISIVAALSDAWAADREPDGKTIWATLTRWQ